MSNELSENYAGELIQDRVKFKLYAAEQHLKNLTAYEQSEIRPSSWKGRVLWEIENESFLFNIIGASDSLLVKINDKLKLKLKNRDVKLGNIKILLNFLNEQHLLSDLDRLEKSPWFQKLKDWRNRTTHTDLLNLLHIPTSTEALKSGYKPKVFLVEDPLRDLEVIPSLESRLQEMKKFIQDVVNNDLRLK
jgi:hypothetical protein